MELKYEFVTSFVIVSQFMLVTFKGSLIPNKAEPLLCQPDC